MPDFLRRLATFLEMIKFSHSVFALPFALIAMLVAAGGIPRAWVLVWIIVAVAAARTAAMCFNRLVDIRIDAANPRTARRALVTGELSVSFAQGALILSVLVFCFAAGMLNYLCLLLATPTLAVLLGYSLTKRFTPYSHLVLGVALGLAPLGAWIAIRESLALFPIVLGFAVMLWVAGFDILYACQDYEADSRSDVFSIPKRLGIAGAMKLARRLHIAAFVGFVLSAWIGSPPLGIFFGLGALAAGYLLYRQHKLVSPGDLSRIDAAFFTTNGLLSVGWFATALVDVLL